METFSSPMIMHSSVLESKSKKQKTPTKTKPNKKAYAARRRPRGGTKTERAPVVSDAQGQPKTELEAQPKPPKRF